LARIAVNTEDIPCLPPRPKPRMFLCPGVKQVQWCPKPTPHYFIVGNPAAVTLVTKHRLIKKAFRNLGYVLAQIEVRGALYNWRQCATTSRPRQPTTTSMSNTVSLALHHEYVEPRGGRNTLCADASPSSSTYLSPPPLLTTNIPVQNKVESDTQDDQDDMPVLLKNKDTSLSDFLNWQPKY
jgi:hypothetical protein